MSKLAKYAFQPGQSGNAAGKMKGTRNALNKKVLEDILDSWKKNGAAALEICFREKPDVYVRAIVSILPREVIFEDVMADVSDEQLDELIQRIRDHLLAGRKHEKEPQALLTTH